MLSPRKSTCFFALAAMLSLAPASSVVAEPNDKPTPRKPRWSQRNDPMVEVTKVCRTIFYELRYACDRNFTGKQVYPRNARCLVRRKVAERLSHVQDELHKVGLGLKIWDAYRPAWAHDILWRATSNPEYVASPAYGGSWHTWGASVDVTLVDLQGREQKMPTDFDDFTDAAKSEYRGDDPVVLKNVQTLRSAMLRAGFKGIRDEWWHFTAEDANTFSPVDMPLEP